MTAEGPPKADVQKRGSPDKTLEIIGRDFRRLRRKDLQG